ncbi:hypothetical protein [Croceimicrobium hydrocarbonivorans]|uniref:Lipoprotein n=1 Tax=Croceimicrobium hydrocarbonivorans TaxID=2761580 RepID=A0A7H0VIE4_9FLAO|nr:hypothetical protein [Croceimicrobium hydrocarbonivorans]QNR25492.1 hypothetical protein H4K34_06535 [Croceimicrobium hydrocarbonivorans]
MRKYIILSYIIILISSCINNNAGLKNKCSFYTPFKDSNVLYLGMSKNEVKDEFSDLSFVDRSDLDVYLSDKVYIAFTEININNINTKVYHQFNFEKDSLYYYAFFFPIKGPQFDTLINRYPLNLNEADDSNFYIQSALEHNDHKCNYKYSIHKSLYDYRRYYIENDHVGNLDTIFEVEVSALRHSK